MCPRFTSTLRISCCRPSSGSQQASARQRGGTRGKMCSASSFLPDLLHFSNWFSAPSSLLLCLARACCVPELGRQQLILSVDVNLAQDSSRPTEADKKTDAQKQLNRCKRTLLTPLTLTSLRSKLCQLLILLFLPDEK